MKIRKLKSIFLEHRLIFLGIFFSFSFWMLEAFICEHVFRNENFFKQCFQPDPHILWARIVVILFGMIIVIYAENMLKKTSKVSKALEESEHKFKAIVDTESDGILLAESEQGRFQFCNKAFCEMIGYSYDELMNMSIKDVHTPEEAEKNIDAARKVQRGELNFVKEVPMLRKDGSIFYADISTASVSFGGSVYAMGLFRDITEHMKAEQALTESEEKYRAIFEQASDSVLLLDTAGNILEFNDEAHENLGYTREEFENIKLPEIEKMETRDEVLKHLSNIIRRGYDKFETKQRRKNKEVRDILVKAKSITIGNEKFIYTVWNDITERKKMEQEILKKNDELESFVYTVSHDLKSPLVTFNGFIEYLSLRNKGNFDEESDRVIERLRANVIHMDHLIRDLLEYSRVGRIKEEIREIRVKELFEEAAERFEVQLEKEKIKLTIEPGWEGVVKVDIKRIEQVLDNLLSNAIKFMGSPKEKEIRLNCRPSVAGKIQICVKDNGIGIDPKYHDKIFEIFHRLGDIKNDSESTGVGLTLVKKIMEEHKGRVWVVSGLGKGSEFCIELPVEGGVKMKIKLANILLVEDNRDHAELTVRVLKENGLINRIDVVEDGEKAIEYLTGTGEFSDKEKFPKPSLILLDIKLPKIDGLDVLKTIKNEESLKKIPVVILTTSESDKDVAAAYDEGASSYIAKPVSFEKFAEKIGDLGFYWTVTNILPNS